MIPRLIGFLLLSALAIYGAACLVSPAHAHDHYTTLKNRQGALCCGGDDCAPYPAENVQEVQGGYLLHDGVFVSRADALPSFDGQFHRCDWNGQKARCFLVPLAS